MGVGPGQISMQRMRLPRARRRLKPGATDHELALVSERPPSPLAAGPCSKKLFDSRSGAGTITSRILGRVRRRTFGSYSPKSPPTEVCMEFQRHFVQNVLFWPRAYSAPLALFLGLATCLFAKYPQQNGGGALPHLNTWHFDSPSCPSWMEFCKTSAHPSLSNRSGTLGFFAPWCDSGERLSGGFP